MKVNVNPPSTGAIDRTKTNERVGEKENVGRARKDEVTRTSNVEISDEARLIQKAAEAVREVSTHNTEKIAELKKSIKNGTYHVDAEALAEKIINEHLRSDFGKNNL